MIVKSSLLYIFAIKAINLSLLHVIIVISSTGLYLPGARVFIARSNEWLAFHDVNKGSARGQF